MVPRMVTVSVITRVTVLVVTGPVEFYDQCNPISELYTAFADLNYGPCSLEDLHRENYPEELSFECCKKLPLVL